jgi:enoyl-CoA hydratase/carnithine racemase
MNDAPATAAMIVTTNHGPVRELRLNRPPVNALTTELLAALRDGIEQAQRDGARALVISGAPGIFSAGLDVRMLIGFDRAGIAELWRELYALMKALAASSIPIVAAITGHAPAGGTVIAVFCDWRVAAEGDFRMGLTEVQVGIPLPPVIFRALKRQVGPRQAERLAVSGLAVTTEEALRAGLVDELVAPERVVERALEWCRSITALPHDAMSITRQRARADIVELFEDNGENELLAVIEAWWSDESQRTLRAVVDRLTKKTP